jgi:hypothetical protein
MNPQKEKKKKTTLFMAFSINYTNFNKNAISFYS